MELFTGPVPVRSMHDLLAVLPYLVGYHPADSVVCVGIRGARLEGTFRFDLIDDPQVRSSCIAVIRETCRHHEIPETVLVGYGDAGRVAATLGPTTTALAGAGVDVDVVATVHVDGGYGHVLDHEFRRVRDIALDPGRSPAVAAAIVHGLVARSSRAAVADLVAPVTGASRDALDHADYVARARLLGLHRAILDPARPTPVIALESRLHRAGTATIRAARRRATAGTALPDTAVAWLALLLQRPGVRDDAIRGCDGSPAEVRLWTDVTRRADPTLAAEPACLLALNAYLAGDDALAIAATERALQTEPDHRLARLIAVAMASGIGQHVLRQIIAGR
ncbi:DUF4192 domain-containing protein [Dactylosporangium sp. CS-047395]|uniref:DUF4192 domain-containing protein n=1 Tax=Dactylosporangium sp. CS-047395 TaxID=3239936 RepID=UPI003D8F8D2D